MTQFLVRYSFLILLLAIGSSPTYGQQGFGTNNPSKASTVEMESANKGLLIPRVALVGVNNFAPITGETATDVAKTNSLLVYNTATIDEDIYPGYYYWSTDGVTGKWNRLAVTGTDTDETLTNIDQDLEAGTFTYTDENEDSHTFNIHWKLDANGTGLAVRKNIASGGYAIALGGGEIGDILLYNTASADGATVSGGSNNTASGNQSTVSGGSGNTALGIMSTISGGYNNTASGGRSTVSGGYGNTAASYGEWVGGVFGTNYTAVNATNFNVADRLFNIGRGTNQDNRRDAFTILKNGKTGVGFDNFENTSEPFTNFNEKFQVNGNARIVELPSEQGNTATDKMVVVDTNGVLKSVQAPPMNFYMPSVVFDTSSAGTGLQRNLYQEYVDQFQGNALNIAHGQGGYSMPYSGGLVGSTGAPAQISVYGATDLYYYITYYDEAVFENLSIDANGVLTYDIIGTATDVSYMVIVFVVKQ